MKPVLLQRLAHLKPTLDVLLKDRLPTHIVSPCAIHCEWKLDSYSNHLILSLKLTADLNLLCQRCGQAFSYPFYHENQIAFCHNQNTLEKLLPEMDCLLIEELPGEITELITDELHLYVPEKHDTCGDL